MKKCPYTVDVQGISSMKGCTLTEAKAEIKAHSPKKHYQLCPPSCYESDYTKCPVYRRYGGLKT